ncbi:DUF7313 family protein [Salinirarus marinus]|uniref:DUF7313 family protein n=1 Tax=Salinirarus marinus TaxID=3068310 RepID=UPI003C6BEF81
MQPLQFVVPLGALEAVEPYIAHIAFAVVLVNLFTRQRAHHSYVEQAEQGAETLSRYTPHVVTSVLLVLVSFGYLFLRPHGGMVLTVLVISLFLSDFFEFEARQVEVRNGMELERPKSALAASVVVFLYAAFQSVFFVIQPVWSAIV